MIFFVHSINGLAGVQPLKSFYKRHQSRANTIYCLAYDALDFENDFKDQVNIL